MSTSQPPTEPMQLINAMMNNFDNQIKTNSSGSLQISNSLPEHRNFLCLKQPFFKYFSGYSGKNVYFPLLNHVNEELIKNRMCNAMNAHYSNNNHFKLMCDLVASCGGLRTLLEQKTGYTDVVAEEFFKVNGETLSAITHMVQHVITLMIHKSHLFSQQYKIQNQKTIDRILTDLNAEKSSEYIKKLESKHYPYFIDITCRYANFFYDIAMLAGQLPQEVPIQQVVLPYMMQLIYMARFMHFKKRVRPFKQHTEQWSFLRSKACNDNIGVLTTKGDILYLYAEQHSGGSTLYLRKQQISARSLHSAGVHPDGNFYQEKTYQLVDPNKEIFVFSTHQKRNPRLNNKYLNLNVYNVSELLVRDEEDRLAVLRFLPRILFLCDRKKGGTDLYNTAVNASIVDCLQKIEAVQMLQDDNTNS